MKCVWKHLRLRGENGRYSTGIVDHLETPPLARRKRERELYFFFNRGNTSACAEKTNCMCSTRSLTQKHLRLRGENAVTATLQRAVLETPPLARRKPLVASSTMPLRGNTSACAEKTRVKGAYKARRWKHLRLRGENLLGLS